MKITPWLDCFDYTVTENGGDCKYEYWPRIWIKRSQ